MYLAPDYRDPDGPKHPICNDCAWLWGIGQHVSVDKPMSYRCAACNDYTMCEPVPGLTPVVDSATLETVDQPGPQTHPQS
jgi:hypothetical protein